MNEQAVTPRKKNTKRRRKSGVTMDEHQMTTHADGKGQGAAEVDPASVDESSLAFVTAMHEQAKLTEAEANAEAEPHDYERLSAREELIALTDELIAAAGAEQEKKAIRATKEELLAAMDSR